MENLLIRISENPGALVGLSAFLATFIASVMADEQNDRLRQGTFGAIAGTSVGGLAAVFQKEPNLLLIGVFGSAVGAVFGWIIYLGLSILASRKWARSLIEYHVSGLKGVRKGSI
jgi:phage shock protein PspC (stress-responsive transcriptional regulator)